MTLLAFTPEQLKYCKMLLATKVIEMMGRKLEENDWIDVYCRAKGFPSQKWSNNDVDVKVPGLGIEQKMLCKPSKKSLVEYCGLHLMHPAATRSLRLDSAWTDPNVAMKNIIDQYNSLMQERFSRVESVNGFVDSRIGWLLWQNSLREFLYWEEEWKPIDVNMFTAEWNITPAKGTRKASKSLWIYETATGMKKYSLTTDAGIKLQPYFMVPPQGDPHIYKFTVISESISESIVNLFVSKKTIEEFIQKYPEVEQIINNVEAFSDFVHERILPSISQDIVNYESGTDLVELQLNVYVHSKLKDVLPNVVNDDHLFQLLSC